MVFVFVLFCFGWGFFWGGVVVVVVVLFFFIVFFIETSRFIDYEYKVIEYILILLISN